MRIVRFVGVIALAIAVAGCVPPVRVSVRNDGVMAIPLEGKVYIYDPRTEKLKPVEPAGDPAKLKLRWAEWSPDGKRLLIEGLGGDGPDPKNAEIQVGDADGGNFKRLLRLEGEEICFLQWHPDGEFISFVAWICVPICVTTPCLRATSVSRRTS